MLVTIMHARGLKVWGWGAWCVISLVRHRLLGSDMGLMSRVRILAVQLCRLSSLIAAGVGTVWPFSQQVKILLSLDKDLSDCVIFLERESM